MERIIYCSHKKLVISTNLLEIFILHRRLSYIHKHFYRTILNTFKQDKKRQKRRSRRTKDCANFL